jgi:single-stranded-DNA-specific exonuclease
MGDKAFFEAMVSVDASLSLDAIDRIFIKEQSQLAPFGTGNPKPLYVFEKITPREVAVFGKSKEHMKLLFDTNGLAREAIAFFMMPSDFKKVPKAGEAIDLYAHVEQSFFMGRMQTRLRIVDIV